jgi:hypothetical protein
MSIVLSLAAAASVNGGAIFCEMLFCFICALITDIMVSFNLKPLPRKAFTHGE